jgi:beta-RFAP synthase
MICVQAPSRLHLGFLSFPHEEFWPNVNGQDGLPARRFGSVGLMVQKPGVRVTARAAAVWSVEGPLADRALVYARRFAQSWPAGTVPPQHVVVEGSAPEHAGLGTGTQLGLAVACAIGRSAGLPTLDAAELARRVGRGRRSAVGIHGFTRGGFLVDGGKRAPEGVAPLIARAPFPDSWRVVLVLQAGSTGCHGLAEAQAFEHVAGRGAALARTEALCRLVLLGMLPALAEGDIEAFGEAVYDFNARVGEAFAPVQEGTYAGPQVAELVAFVRHQGVRGVGQSSWGPTVFALTESQERADDLVTRIRQHFRLGQAEVFATPVCNGGAEVSSI